MFARRSLLAAAAALSALLAGPAAADAATPQPFGLPCTEQEGVRFCPGSVDTRVPTFDGVPLDVNVTLPATGDGPWPLVIQLHGYGGRKTGLRDSREWAVDGYAVLNFTARGFGESCGSRESRLADPAGCARGWIKLGDTRYEARDSQHLAGLLVDQGIADPKAIAAMGGSYGGGQSLALGLLRDRIRRPDGSYAPWRSPQGTPISLAAAAPSIPWSDLVQSLVPNGRTLDYAIQPPAASLDPVGVLKESYVAGLYASGQASGYYAPPGADPDADLTTWFAAVNAGEPYDPNPLAREVVDEIASNHSPFHLELDRDPAPLFISNGFTDDLFPVDEAVRMANRIRAERPRATVAQLHFDHGHARGQNKEADRARYRAAIHRFFDRHVKGDRRADAPQGVTALTQTCPKDAPSGGPFHASTWDRLSPGEVRGSGTAGETVQPYSGDVRAGLAFGPIAGDGACATVDGAPAPGTVTFDLPAAGEPYTLLGSPTVIADLTPAAPGAALHMRLLDVAPDGQATLVARGTYRVGESGRRPFQLHPGAWRFETGHVPRLELLQADTPYARVNNLPIPVAVGDLELRLPVAERPGRGAVRPPAPDVLPEGARPVPPGPGGPTRGEGGPAAVSVRTLPRSRRATADHGLRVRVACPAACTIRLRAIRAKDTTAGLRTIRLGDGGRRTVTVPLRRDARRAVRRGAALRLTARVRDERGGRTLRRRAPMRG